IGTPPWRAPRDVLNSWHLGRVDAGRPATARGGGDVGRGGGGVGPSRTADHVGRLRAGGGDGAGGPRRPPRPAWSNGRPHTPAYPRREGAPEAPAGRHETRLPAEPAARPCRAVGAAPGAPDVLRRLARKGRRRTPGGPLRRALPRGTGA